MSRYFHSCLLFKISGTRRCVWQAPQRGGQWSALSRSRSQWSLTCSCSCPDRPGSSASWAGHCASWPVWCRHGPGSWISSQTPRLWGSCQCRSWELGKDLLSFLDAIASLVILWQRESIPPFRWWYLKCSWPTLIQIKMIKGCDSTSRSVPPLASSTDCL